MSAAAKKRRLDFGRPREGCLHRDRLVLVPASVNAPMELHDGGQTELMRSVWTEWCRSCGAIRFKQDGHFVIPRRLR